MNGEVFAQVSKERESFTAVATLDSFQITVSISTVRAEEELDRKTWPGSQNVHIELCSVRIYY